MTYFTASIQTIVLRFFLMMAIIIVAIFAGVPYLAILSLPVFISAMVGLSFQLPKATESASTRQINKRTVSRRAA